MGDIFDGPTDLIILPCSTDGTVTPFVQSKLSYYSIENIHEKLSPGEVLFMPFKGAENIAQYVAFAASVHRSRSSMEVVEHIGRTIGNLTKDQWGIRTISAPLLGSGAGGLRNKDSAAALTEGFLETASPAATLVLHALDRRIFEEITNKIHGNISPKKPNRNKRVFISYSSVTSRSQAEAIRIAEFLRQNGIDARLDKWHLRYGMDLPQWMTNELELADRVIIISDAMYKERADRRSGGVGWETMIIQGDMSQQPVENRKYIAIIIEDNIQDGIPVYLRTKYCIHWQESEIESVQNALLREIYDIDAAPPIGEVPSVFITKDIH
ncbi:MAG: TIR domain-containing protein [Hyphomicrobiales bacterium]